ncbi:hypothetical protein [Gorillibacterium massiliense]|uniref:hypothetical protein n=1 Tax=Gorillibacterium massiliense TaxID=1280390 RepID=UPI0004AF5768|nr:hypothetical protein [Gorillibacterium massiliense]
MRKLLLVLLVLGLLLGGAYYGAVRYIQPKEQLTLDYKPFDLGAKIREIAESGQFAVTLNDEEMNSLFVSKLAEDPNVASGVRITGARFTRDQDVIYADVNLLLRGRWKAGVQLTYRLAWEPPYLKASFQQASIHGKPLPKSLLDIQDVAVPVNEMLPPLIAIKNIQFNKDAIKVSLKLQIGK